jgi:hypothetical protein
MTHGPNPAVSFTRYLKVVMATAIKSLAIQDETEEAEEGKWHQQQQRRQPAA